MYSIENLIAPISWEKVVGEIRELIAFSKSCEEIVKAYHQNYVIHYKFALTLPNYPTFTKLLIRVRKLSPQAYNNFTGNIDLLYIYEYLTCENMEVIQIMDRIWHCQRHLSYLEYSMERIMEVQSDEKIRILKGLTLVE